jgi:hypothetical protein
MVQRRDKDRLHGKTRSECWQWLFVRSDAVRQSTMLLSVAKASLGSADRFRLVIDRTGRGNKKNR